MTPSRTISELKSSFIRSQIRILSERLEPEEGWEDYGPQSEDLSEKVVEEALQKCKRAFQYSQMAFTLGSMI
jgi:Kinetochore complex Fta4 of Sim4 subunit, or CENP-50